MNFKDWKVICGKEVLVFNFGVIFLIIERNIKKIKSRLAKLSKYLF